MSPQLLQGDPRLAQADGGTPLRCRPPRTLRRGPATSRGRTRSAGPSGLAARRDLRLSELDEQLCLLADFEADLQGLGFERGGHRQHDVGNFGCRGHEQVGLDEEIQAAQAITDSKIAAVSADITALIAKVGAVPLLGLTPEQQAAIDDIAVHANKINDALAGVDASANAAP